MDDDPLAAALAAALRQAATYDGTDLDELGRRLAVVAREQTGVRRVPKLPAELVNRRDEVLAETEGSRMITSRRNPVEPVPVGTYVAMVFEVTGYRPDCDGSLMADVAAQYNAGRYDRRRDEHGQSVPAPTVRWEGDGWEPTHLGLSETGTWVLDDPGVLDRLAAPATTTPHIAPQHRSSGA